MALSTLITDPTITHLKAIRNEIDQIPRQTTNIEVTTSLSVLCETLIELFEGGVANEPKIFRQRFNTILSQLVKLLQAKQSETSHFLKFIDEKLGQTKVLRKKGNKQQILWTGVNCIANGVGLAALFVPGLNVPFMVVGITGSIFGICGRIATNNEIKKGFNKVMSDIEQNQSYRLITFSEMVVQKQDEFEQRIGELVNNYGYRIKDANIVAIIEMTIECLSRIRLVPPTQPAGITGELSSDILSQLKNTISVLFNKYGKHAFNLIDDTFEITSNTMKVASSTLIVVTFAINMYQIYSEMKDRDESVEKIEEMSKMLSDGRQSLQFFINVIQDIRMNFYQNSQMQMEDELGQLRNETVLMRDELQRQEQRFQALVRCLLNNRSPQQLSDASNEFNSIEFNQND